jgi:hypothetical protein
MLLRKRLNGSSWVILRNFLAALALFTALPASVIFSADTRIEVARIIDKAAAESILGDRVKDPTPRNIKGKDGYYSKCNYYSAAPGKLLILRLYQAAPGFDIKQELDQVRASSGLSKSLSGIGDRAELASGPAGGLSTNVTMLYVVKGETLITVGLRGLEEEIAVEKAKEIAQKILERL